MLCLQKTDVFILLSRAEPRVVDKPYLVDNMVIPQGTIISCLPYSFHRTEGVFPEPDKFLPERWIINNEQDKWRVKHQEKYMMPFGKGVRMCLGMNLAMIEMKIAIAKLYWHYSSTIDETWCRVLNDAKPIKMGGGDDGTTDQDKMRMYDWYTTRPLYDECWLKWERL